MSTVNSCRSLTLPLLTLVVVNILPGFYFRPVWSMILAFVLVGYRAYLEWNQLTMPPRWALWFGQVSVLIAIWQHYGSLFGDEASGTLLSLLLCLKIFELRKARDYFFSALLCFLVLMSFLLFSQSLFITAFMLVDMFLIFTLLYAIEEGYSGDRLKVTQFLKGTLKPTAKLAFKAIPLIVIIFLMFPRFSTGFGTSNKTSGKTGIDDELKPGSISQLLNSDELVFRATYLNGEIPRAADRYWRGAVLDISKGLNWERSKAWERRKPLSANESAGDIEIYLEPGFDNFLFTLENTRTVFFPNDFRRVRIGARNGNTFELASPLQTRERYFIQSDQVVRNQNRNLQTYLHVDEEPSERIQNLLNTYKGRSQGEIVRGLMDLFGSGDYRYTLSPPKVKNLDEFLFDTKVGFCEHFAASLATLLRYSKIPARVVVGFQGGTVSFLENYLSVRGHDAHAWVEYFDAGSSRWRRLDPTGRVAPLRITQGSETYLGQSDQVWISSWVPQDLAKVFLKGRALFDDVEATWMSFLMRFDLARQRQILQRLGMEEVIFRALPVFLVLVIALFAAILYFFEAQRRTPLNAEGRVYRDFVRMLRRRKIYRQPNEGLQSLLDRIERENAEIALQLRPIFASVIALRFSPVAKDKAFLSSIKRQIQKSL